MTKINPINAFVGKILGQSPISSGYGFIDAKIWHMNKEIYFRLTSLINMMPDENIRWKNVVFELNNSSVKKGTKIASNIIIISRLNDPELLIHLLFNHLLYIQYPESFLGADISTAFKENKFEEKTVRNHILKQIEVLKNKMNNQSIDIELLDTPFYGKWYNDDRRHGINTNFIKFIEILKIIDEKNFKIYLKLLTVFKFNTSIVNDFFTKTLFDDDFENIIYSSIAKGDFDLFEMLFFKHLPSSIRVKAFNRLSNHKYKNENTKRLVHSILIKYTSNLQAQDNAINLIQSGEIIKLLSYSFEHFSANSVSEMIILLNKKRYNVNNEQVSDIKHLINTLKIILQQKLVADKNESPVVKNTILLPKSSNNDLLSDSLINDNWDIEDIEEYNEEIKSYNRKIKLNSGNNKSKYCPNCQESPCMCSDPDPG